MDKKNEFRLWLVVIILFAGYITMVTWRAFDAATENNYLRQLKVEQCGWLDEALTASCIEHA